MIDPVLSERGKAAWEKIRDREARMESLRTMLKIFGYDEARIEYLSPKSKFRQGMAKWLSNRSAPFSFHVTSKQPVEPGYSRVKQLHHVPNIDMLEKCVKSYIAYEQKQCWV